MPACYAQGVGSLYETRRPEGTTQKGKPGLGEASIFDSTDLEVKTFLAFFSIFVGPCDALVRLAGSSKVLSEVFFVVFWLKFEIDM